MIIVLVVIVGVVLRVREATSSDRPLHQVLLIRRKVGLGLEGLFGRVF